MLTRNELALAKLFLEHAQSSVLWCASLFFHDGNHGAAARLRDIANRLADEMRDIETLLKSFKP